MNGCALVWNEGLGLTAVVQDAADLMSAVHKGLPSALAANARRPFVGAGCASAAAVMPRSSLLRQLKAFKAVVGDVGCPLTLSMRCSAVVCANHLLCTIQPLWLVSMADPTAAVAMAELSVGMPLHCTALAPCVPASCRLVRCVPLMAVTAAMRACTRH